MQPSGGQYLYLKGVFATTATEGSLQSVRDRVATYHLEQLLNRKQPEGRSERSWQSILDSVQTSLISKLDSLHSVVELYQFAHKTLKSEDLKEAFREFVFDDVSEFAVPEQAQQDFILSEREAPSFERDLELFERDLALPVLLSEQETSGDPDLVSASSATAGRSSSSATTSVFQSISKGRTELGDLDFGSSPKRARFSTSRASGCAVDLESDHE